MSSHTFATDPVKVPRFLAWMLPVLISFNGCREAYQNHPIVRYYEGELILSKSEADSLIKLTLEEANHNYPLAIATYMQALRLRFAGQNPEAFRTYEKSKKLLRECNVKDNYLNASILKNQGVILYNYGEFDKANAHYKKAFEFGSRYSRSEGESIIYNTAISTLHSDPKSALSILFDQLKRSESDTVRRAKILNRLGFFEREAGNYDRALDFYQRALETGVSGRTLANIKQNISDLYYHKGDYKRQEAFLQEVLAIEGANRFLALMDLGECYLLQGRNNQALEVLQAAEVLYDEQPTKHEHFKLFKWLALVSSDPTYYSERLIEEQGTFILRADELRRMVEQEAIRSMLESIETTKEAERKMAHYRWVIFVSLLVSVSILLFWYLWRIQLRRSIENILGA